MDAVEEDSRTERRVHLTLESTAEELSCYDLLRVAEVAEQARAAIHISHGSWQVLIGVPERYSQTALEALRALGHRAVSCTGPPEAQTAFALK